MKKKYGILAGIALMALASCTSDGIEIEHGQKQTYGTIEFSSFSENGTRASKQVGYTFNVGEKISVYGFESNDTMDGENQLFNNQEVTNTAGQNNQIWTYSPKKFWTSGNRYEFYAAYPYEQPFAFDASTKYFSIKDFTVSNDTAKQVDLMIAERNYATPNNTVELNFHHILSNVNFYAKVAAGVDPKEITSVDIVSLDVTGLLATGSYQQTGWTANHQAEGEWTTPLPKSEDFCYDFPGLGAGHSTALKVDGNEYKGVATDLLLMPQTLFYVDDPEAGISAKMDPVLKVSFKVSYADATSQVFNKTLRLSSLLSYKKRTLELQEDGTYGYSDYVEVNEPIYKWEPNYKYNYFLTFNPAKTTRIWDTDCDGNLGDDTDGQPNEKEGGSRYNPDDPNVIQVWEDKDGDGEKDDDEWVEYSIAWEDIDGDGYLEGGIDKDGDGHIDNVDGDNTTEYNNHTTYDPTDGDVEHNPDGKDAILAYVDTDGDGEPDKWVQLEKDPETGEIKPGKDTEENYIEFTAIVSDWEVEYGDVEHADDIDWEITK